MGADGAGGNDPGTRSGPAGGGPEDQDAARDAAQGALATVERFGAVWGDHDLEGALALLTEDCVFDATGPAPDGARAVGRAAIRQAWQPIFDDRASRFEAEETFAAGDRVVQLWRYGWGDGHVRGVDVFRVRDGLVAEKLSYVKG